MTIRAHPSMAAFSAADQEPPQYQMFINFRGALRKGLMSFLKTELDRNGINYIIDEEMRKGRPLTDLYREIEESKIALVVFSTKYAESDWCLNELLKINARKDEGKLVVIPVFYKVKVTNVKNLNGWFGKAFWKKHGHEGTHPAGDARIDEWKKALLSVSSLFARKLESRTDAEFVNEIVEDVKKQLTALSLEERKMSEITLLDVLFKQRLYKYIFCNFYQYIPTKSNANGLDRLLKEILLALLEDNTLGIRPAEIAHDVGEKKQIGSLLRELGMPTSNKLDQMAHRLIEFLQGIFDWGKASNDQDQALIAFYNSRNALKRYTEGFALEPLVTIHFPGSQIPPCYSHTAVGSMLKLQLPPHWCDSNFVGLTLSAVVQIRGYENHTSRFSVNCKFEINKTDGSRVSFTWIVGGWEGLGNEPSRFSLDHVFVSYTSCFQLMKLLEENKYFSAYTPTTASLEFYVTDGTTDRVAICEVVRSGLSILHAAHKTANDSGICECPLCHVDDATPEPPPPPPPPPPPTPAPLVPFWRKLLHCSFCCCD